MPSDKEHKLKYVGEYTKKFNEVLGVNLKPMKIYQSSGLSKHVLKRHPSFVNYIGNIPDIIRDPDYIGINPSEDNSLELIKKYDKYVLLAIKLDSSGKYLYVASIYGIESSKIKRRLHSGRLKKAKSSDMPLYNPSKFSVKLASF